MDGNRTTATIPTTGTLSRRLGALAAAAPAAPAIEHVAGGRIERLDRAALLRRAARLAAGLRAVRPGPGADPPVVPIVLRHDPDLVPLFVAGLLAGVRPCVLAWPTPRLDRGRWAESFRRLLEAVEAPLVVTRGDLASVVDSAAPTGARAIDVADLLAATDDLRSRRHEIAAGGLLDGMDDVEAALDPTAVAFLQFSSGTTGTPKGLGLSHRAVLEQVAAYARAIDLGPGDRVVSWLPLYHDMGLVAATLLPLLAGVPVTMLDPMEWVARPALLLEHVARSRATLCWQPNFAFEFLARAVPREAAVPDLSSVRAWINCSEPVRDRSFAAFRARFAAAGVADASLLACYAMAENTFAVTQTPPGRPARRFVVDAQRLEREEKAVEVPAGAATARTLVSSGPPIDGVELGIVDAAGRPLPDGRVGRIVVASPSQFPGYWPRSDLRGRYDTGDLGVIIDGELVVTGRAKDLIIVRGRNVQPHDLEAAATEVPGVRHGRVVALGRDDDEAGTQSILLLVEPEDAGTGTGADEAARRLAAEVRRHVLATCDVPELEVATVPPRWLVKTSSGKIARGANLERWRRRGGTAGDGATAADAPAITGGGLADAIDAWVIERGGDRRRDRGLGARIDSLALVECAAWLEATAGWCPDEAARGRLADLDADAVARLVAGPIAGAAPPPRTAPGVLVAVGGDGSLAERTLEGWAEDAAEVERLGLAPRKRIFFRRRLDALAGDLETIAVNGRPAWWSPDLDDLRRAEVVVVDLFGDMLAAPDVRLPGPGEAPTPADHLVAIRWLPVDGAPGPLVIEPARRATPVELAAALDRIADRIDGTLVVITHGARNVRTMPWGGWIAEVNAHLRRVADGAAWRLADAGRAMDAIEPGHYRAPWVDVPEAHAAAARGVVQAEVEAALAARPVPADGPRGVPSAGFGGRRRAAHACVAEIDGPMLERWSRGVGRVSIVGPAWSAPGLEAALAARGVEATRYRELDDVAPGGDAVIVLAGRHPHERLEALSRRLGDVPVESPLTQPGGDEASRLWRAALRELWRRLAATGAPVALVGDGRVRRIGRRVVADLPAPHVVCDRVDPPMPGLLPAGTVLVLLAERDKDAQAACLAALPPDGELVVPAAWAGRPHAALSPVFAPDAAETFLREGPEAPAWPVEGRWTA